MPLFSVLLLPMLGFAPDRVEAQRSREQQFDAVVSSDDQLAWLKRLSAVPHHVGSPGGQKNAEFMRDLYASFGFDAKIESFQVLFAEPKVRRLSLGKWRASLKEPGGNGLPTYNCYSTDGDVSGQIVYVNQGLPEDYKVLEERGIDVKGKIVLVRYGGCWRGLKPKLAGEHGAVGCLIYSDPRDDGFAQGSEYPEGGWRSRVSAQRGSVADMPTFPGDPLTPGIGSVPGAPRLDRKDAPTLTKIPVMPLGWADAEPLLKDLTGPVAPASWRGGLPFAYRLGPSKQTARFTLKFDWKTVDCRNVIATLKGSEKPDQWVLRGNHHDAWVYGANDPLSGQVAMLSEAKALGSLYKSGWRPKRSIVYCSWDGEEEGLLGSAEWVETHQEELNNKAVLYINSDSTGRGILGVSGSHALEKFVTEVAGDVTDPETKATLLDRMRARDIVSGSADERKRAREKGDLTIDALGAGSDYSPFIQHLGIASLDLGMGGEGEGTQYHSNYDNYDWQTRFADPGAVYGAVLAKYAGRLVMRVADADTLPFRYQSLAQTVEGYVAEIEALYQSVKASTEEHNRRLQEGSLRLSQDPTAKLRLPAPLDSVPAFDFAPLKAAVARLKSATATRSPLSDQDVVALERAMLGSGLPSRPWYRNTIYAPGTLTGYGAKTLPGVREALEQRRWADVEPQMKEIVAALDRMVFRLNLGG